jgi:phycobilisome rod-core linker protein
MAIPVLSYSPSSQNQRVKGYEIPGEEQPRIYSTKILSSARDIDDLIWAAYYQVFHEQQMLASNRQTFLESQLRYGLITVKDFIRGLATSDSFRRLNYDSNNNYRFVEMCIQRLLGRPVYNEREKLAWSIVLATKGLKGFIDELLDTQEYVSNFGDNIVPYQRRRILPQRLQGDLPFARMSRYDEDYRDRVVLPSMAYKPSQRFNLRAFLSSSNSDNRDVVLWQLVTLLGLMVSWIVLPALGYLPHFGGY